MKAFLLNLDRRSPDLATLSLVRGDELGFGLGLLGLVVVVVVVVELLFGVCELGLGLGLCL